MYFIGKKIQTHGCMVKLTSEIKEIFNSQKFVPFATCAGNISNVVYILYKKLIDDETILIGDIYLDKTLKNLKKNPKASIVVLSDKSPKSFQIKGSVKIYTSGKIYADTKRWIQEKGEKDPVKSAVVLKIDEVYDNTPGKGAGKRIL
jgi:hypothetical protein